MTLRQIAAKVGLAWLLLGGACVGKVSLDPRPCPCAEGYVCCAGTAMCVPSAAAASCAENQGAPNSSGSTAGMTAPQSIGGEASLEMGRGGSAGAPALLMPALRGDGGAAGAGGIGGDTGVGGASAAAGDNADAGSAGHADGIPHDTWLPMSAGPLSARDSQVMVWAGDGVGNGALVVWGGIDNDRDLGHPIRDGARYYPRDDRWAAISMEAAPSARYAASAVWTGKRVLIWGGTIVDEDPGASYDPLNDTWQPIAPCPFTVLGYGSFSTWTGSRMLVFNSQVARGASYDPESDVWSAMSTNGAPNTPYGSAVWTGKRWILWGGQALPGNGLQKVNTGAIYDPANDTWTPTSTQGAPIARQDQSALWTGSRMLIWGGTAPIAAGSDQFYQVADGGLYDPETDTWQALSVPAQLQVPTLDATASSTGSSLLFWGGFAGDNYAQHGVRFDLSDSSWTALSVLHQPLLRVSPRSVWTGVEMLVWGGFAASDDLASGARYFP